MHTHTHSHAHIHFQRPNFLINFDDCAVLYMLQSNTFPRRWNSNFQPIIRPFYRSSNSCWSLFRSKINRNWKSLSKLRYNQGQFTHTDWLNFSNHILLSHRVLIAWCLDNETFRLSQNKQCSLCVVVVVERECDTHCVQAFWIIRWYDA